MADLMLFYIETGVAFTAEYRDIWEQFYTTLENNFAKAMEFIWNNDYMDELLPSIKAMLKQSEHCGWGFPDTLYDIYSEWVDDGDDDIENV